MASVTASLAPPSWASARVFAIPVPNPTSSRATLLECCMSCTVILTTAL